jgi:hypothetical protein
VYLPSPSARYTAELREIEAGTGAIAAALESGAYRILRRDPRKGAYMPTAGLWVIRQIVVRGLLVVQVYYQIHDDREEFELLSIRSIDLTTL